MAVSLSRRRLLLAAVAAPFVITTPRLLMPGRGKIVTVEDMIEAMWDFPPRPYEIFFIPHYIDLSAIENRRRFYGAAA